MKSALGMIMMVLLILAAMGLPAQGEIPDRAVVQKKIESGLDLGSRARQVLFRARIRMENGDAAGAVDALDNWLNGHPDRDHYLLRFERALVCRALDRPDSVLVDLRRSVALEPRFARAWLLLGEVAYRQEAYGVAAEAFGRGYALTPDPQPEMLHYQGVCLLLDGQAEQAVVVLAALLRENRAEAKMGWYRALIAADLACAEPGAASPLLDHLVEDFASNREAWDLAARYAAARQQYRAAVVYLAIADDLQPLDAEHLRQLGDLYSACEVPLQAARCYQRALALKPQVVDADSVALRQGREDRERLASAWLAAHRPGLARESLQAAVKADPDFGRGYLLLGYSALALGLEDEAREDFRRAQSYPDQAPDAGRILNSLAENH